MKAKAKQIAQAINTRRLDKIEPFTVTYSIQALIDTTKTELLYLNHHLYKQSPDTFKFDMETVNNFIVAVGRQV